MPSRNGRNSGYAFILRDLGEIRRLQAEIRRQDRLAALGHMAAGIAHEIRNPLSAIKGLARFFREISPEGGEEARVAGIMTQEVQRLDRVVGDLLELARPDKLNLTGISPALPLERAANLVRADMDKLEFTLTVAEDLDCSGLPDLGHVVCTYDEGFISGLFKSFTGKSFEAKEVDCWCTGDRTCRFEVKPATE